MASIRFGQFTRGRAALFRISMMLTIVGVSMAYESP